MASANVWRSIVAGSVILCLFPRATSAADSASLEWGTGNATRMARIGVQWDWASQWWKSDQTHLGGYWDLTLAEWQGRQYRNIPGEHQYITDIGITPVLRLEGNDKRGLYGELGIGAHLLSKLYDNNDRKLSTHFQFGSHLGIGYAFGNNLDIAVKYQHFSNGGIKEPNSGVNFTLARILFRF